MTTEVAVRDDALNGLEMAERMFTPERREAIARFLNVTPDEPALLPYLATCASYQLDPIMGQIWLIPQRVKIRSKDGSGDQWGERLRPSVGRDGFLAIARRDPRYRGVKFGVVCEHDTFEVDHTEGQPDVKMLPWGFDDLPRVMHRQASKPTVFEEAVNPARWRGRILGAWAKAYVHGQPPEFFFAPIHEHIRMRERTRWEGGSKVTVRDEAGRPVLEPDGAWGYVSTMILKAAQSYVLRIALGITGVVPGDELAGGQLGAIDSTAREVPGEAEFDWDQLRTDGGLAPVELRDRLRAAVGRVNELVPLSWSPAKVEMVAQGRPVDELAALCARVEGEAEVLAARRADRSATGPSEGREGDGASAPDVPAEALSGAQVEPSDAEVVDSVEALEETKRVLEEQLREPGCSEEDRLEIQNELDGIDREITMARNSDQGRMDV